MSGGAIELYASSNGDRWTLTADASGLPVVEHTPTLSSGGHVTLAELGAFLSRDRSSPQHQALLRLIATLVSADDRAGL